MCNVLFVCPDNAVLGPMAEACLNRAACGEMRAFSAAVHPAGRLHPRVERLLRGRGHATDALQPKSWEIFALPHAPAPDLLIGLGLRLPFVEPEWNGHPQRRHWHLTALDGDPAAGDIPALYQAIKTAVSDFLLDENGPPMRRAG
ncbi:protein-tyrosine-phosphatase [Breoghania corrubedonensis]|uniref:Protein-tyrosine-phosphatase n=1 Tax=Breoghania corrubedonensis TaxID=665038 RepID=A0A2T5VGU0_9HYPH|nr:low molecular weight phosphatase family protein [Breoghania corrubedonensis]PTW62964.1 protein-tyrosine-phosphatase [Breoghania corrubedonensis]